MTTLELHTALDIELDKSGVGWFIPSEKDYFLNRAYEKLLEELSSRFEIDERVRRALQKLLTDSASQTGSVYNLLLVSDIHSIVSVRGDFSFSCNGKSETHTLKIRPVPNDSLEVQDALGGGTNGEPIYEEVNSTLVIYSDSAPTNVIVRYIKTPARIDITTAPTASPEIQDDEHRFIVYYARDMMLLNLESKRYQLSKAETTTD